jgi:hypothetical protein
MAARWFYSQFFADPQTRALTPVATAYGNGWYCPILPTVDGGWALCQVNSGSHQLEAAAQDPRVIVLPLLFDPAPVSQTVIDAYSAQGAIAGMSMGALISKLAELEPCFGVAMPGTG